MKNQLFMSAVLSFGVTALLGLWLIPFLRRLKYGQTILDIGPKWHKTKQGTPTMGGLMFIFGIVAAVSVCFVWGAPTLPQGGGFSGILNTRMIAGLIMALIYALIGFIDDYVKVSKKQNLGLTAIQKLAFQFIAAAIYLWCIYSAGDRNTQLMIPFFDYIDFGIFYFPLCAVGIVYVVNSVNLTDGIDGLASCVTFVASLGFLAVSVMLDFSQIGLMSAATAGGCLGFLVYNFYPAKVFMGDTGSMFLGGMVVAMAFGVGMPMLLALAGIVYICESLSVVLQVISFKTTGKRIFKMSPIHHHFEMSGFSEVQIVMTASMITLAGSALMVLVCSRL